MNIKTRDSLCTIKTFDRAKTLGQKVKKGAGEVKEYGAELQNPHYESANEYAGNTVENTEGRMAKNLAYSAGKVGNWGIRETRKNLPRWRGRLGKGRRTQQNLRSLPALQRPSLPKPASRSTARSARCAAQSAAGFARKTTKAVVTAVKATVFAIKETVAAIAAGGWIAVVVILLLCMTGFVLASVFGIFAPTPGNKGGVTIPETVRELRAEYEGQIAELRQQGNYDGCFVTGEPCEWQLAVAVYAVKTNGAGEVVTFDEKKAEVLKEIYRNLNRIDWHAEQIVVIETHLEPQPDGSIAPAEREVEKCYLYIDTVSLTAEDAATLYGFDADQREQLFALLSDRNKEMWEGLLS